MQLRSDNLQQFKSKKFDVLIIGGGINGAVSAAALAAKGLDVALVDRSDFASECSSNSSNLVWGGIKYLESGEWWLVRKLCQSRNRLMRHYPSSVREIRFLAAIKKDFRMPIIFVYFGALIYWAIGGFFTRAPKYLSQKSVGHREPVVNDDVIGGGVEYSDCYLPDNDARFVFNFIRSAINNGASIANYVSALNSEFENGQWRTACHDLESGDEFRIQSKVLINCCGPYADHYNHSIAQVTKHQHVFSKGIHLIVKRITSQEKVLAFFASDGRLFFVIPMGSKTCIGTTDTRVESPQTKVTDTDRQFVLDNVNSRLNLSSPLTKADIISERCGVRPLVTKKSRAGAPEKNWMKLSRKHEIDSDEKRNFICVFGGKLTDCLNVGEEIENLVFDLKDRNGQLLCKDHGGNHSWYGEPKPERYEVFMKSADRLGLDQQTDAKETLAQRFWRRYGERSFQLLDAIEREGESILTKPIPLVEYCQGEIELIARTEMVTRLDDFFRRRSKAALVESVKDIVEHPGLEIIARCFFGDLADEKITEYRQSIESQPS